MIAKELFNVRLEKRDIEYIKFNAKNQHISQAKFLHDSLVHYRDTFNFVNVEIPNKFANLVFDVYNKMFPLLFTFLSAYFFYRQNWLFLVFICVAVTPFILNLRIEDVNTIKVGL